MVKPQPVSCHPFTPRVNKYTHKKVMEEYARLESCRCGIASSLSSTMLTKKHEDLARNYPSLSHQIL